VNRLGRLMLVMVWVAVGGLPPVIDLSVAQAQENLPIIHMMDTVFGSLDDSSPEARWQFAAEEGDRVSLVVQALEGDLDPDVQIIDGSGRMLAENDDIAFPDRTDSALEGVQIPRADTYTIRVTRFGFEDGDSQGAFALTLLPAYADPIFWDDFTAAPAWSAGGGELVDVAGVDGQLELAVRASNALVWAAPEAVPALPLRAYLQAEASVANEPDYWEVGLIFRQTSPTSYYLFSVSSRGDWAFLARAGASTWLHLQNWTEHPALADLTGRVTLGVLMDGNQFTFYVDGTPLATLTDDTHAEPGTFALSAGTVDQQDTLPVIRYDNVLAVEPLPPAVAAEEVTGEPLASWEAPEAGPIMDELVAQGVIPAGASQVMYVPSSFIQASRAGIQTLPLGQGRRGTDFVMGTTVVMESASNENGCGLVFRRQSADRYSLFFLDGLGGYGLAEWNLDRFEPAAYEMGQAVLAEENRNRIVLVAQDDRVRVYLNGDLVLVRPNPPLEGGVGIASLGFDDTFVDCRFGDTWLWTWP
jgi:hypothetical protein